MTNKLGNRVKMTVSGAPGTGTITLGLATSGFQSLDAAGILNGDTIPYVIEDGTNWEVGVGTYSTTGPSLARTTVTESSAGGAKISASADAIVMLSPLAADMQSGTSANQVVRLDGSAKLPAVDGSALTALNASNIASGTLGGARLPTPTTTVLGGVKSATAATHQFQTGVDTTGAPTFAQPAAGDVTGLAASATTDTTNASNISSGTLGGARLPTPTTSVLGGVKSATAPSNQFQTGIDTTGAPTFAQPSASNITGLAASATTDTTNASNISTGTLAGARLPTPTTTALGGVKSATAGANQFQTGIDTSGIPTFAQPSASNISGLGTAATLNVGTSASNIVQLDGSAKLPAVDGSQLTNLLAVTITGATGAANLPTGTTVQRPTGSAGQLRYNSTTGKFEGYGAAWGNIGGGAAISDAAPSNPGAGDLWWNSADGILYVYYSDGSSSQWVGASSGGMGQYLPLTGGSINGSLTISTPLGVASGGTGLTSLTTGYIPFGAGSSAFGNDSNLFWDNTNKRLGIGTSSPSSLLHLSAASPVLRIADTTASGGIAFIGTDTTGLYFRTFTADTTRFLNSAGSETLRIASDGSVGIGTTSPSTYANSYGPVLVVGTGNNFATIQGRTDGPSGAGNGVAFGGSYQTNPINGSRIWFGAQGSAGQRGMIGFYVKNVDDNTTQPTQAMTLDASGNLGVGTTASDRRLDILGVSNSLQKVARFTPAAEVATIGELRTVVIQRSANDGVLALGYVTGPDAWCISASYGSTGSYKPLTFATSDQERVRIDAAGRFLIGATSFTGAAQATLMVANGSAVNGNAARLGLMNIGGASNGSDYPSIGYNLAYTSTSTINYLSNDYASMIRFAAGKVETFTAASGTATNAISFTTGPYVAQGGTSWTSGSDERIKDIIEPITDALTKVMSLRAIIGKFKTDPVNARRAFLIAQDVQKVLPEAVDTSDPERLGLNYTDIIPLLVASTKELAAEVAILKGQLNG